jgi:hypothetical protein
VSDVFRKLVHGESESCVEVGLYNIAREEHIEADSPGIRLYSVFSDIMHDGENASWSLQVRGGVRTRSRRVSKQFAIASAGMTRDDLEWLAKQIAAALAENRKQRALARRASPKRKKARR